jgi:large subunit ribosomal protein L3
MRTGLIAKKIGMTQIFEANGLQVPVTVLQVEPCRVLEVKTQDKDGYDAVKLGSGHVKPQRVSKPIKGYFAKLGMEPLSEIKEFRVSTDVLPEIGSELKVDFFQNGQLVDVTGTSVGKGFAGAMKRHHFGGLRASHGVSVVHRSHGSTGNRQDPGKVFKNKKMAGHMGARRVTKLNLTIHAIDLDKNLIFIKGSVPGAKNGVVYIRDAIKATAK